MTGRFITFEGIDGSGKSTQTKALAAYLRDRGVDVVETREPGGSEGAEAIRALLVEGATDRWSAETEILLFTAARRDHLEKTIRPALARGATVICDRFVDSTRVYQGVVRAELSALVDAIHELAIGIEPDLTILVDINPQEALRRCGVRNDKADRFEKFGLEFQRRLREGFLAMAREQPQRFRIVPGDASPEDVSAQIAAFVDTL